MPRSFALGEQFDAFIDEQIESGNYRDTSEVVRAGLRLLEDQQRRYEAEQIRQVIEEGRRTGSASPAVGVFDRVEARIRAAAGRDPG